MDEIWDSGWVTHETPTLFVPRRIVQVCNAIQSKNPHLEWSILLKGEWTKYGFEIANDYIIPKQEVTGGNVEFDEKDKEDCIVKGYNVILHSHHSMTGIKFSHPDHTTLTDSSFAASLLYNIANGGEISTATITITIKEGIRVAVVPEIVEVEEETVVDIVGIENIAKKVFEYDHIYDYTKGKKRDVKGAQELTDPTEQNFFRTYYLFDDGVVTDRWGYSLSQFELERLAEKGIITLYPPEEFEKLKGEEIDLFGNYI
jgi:hypothetical protein